MNEAKAARVESGLNGIARKVLDVVPLAEAWLPQQIVGELARATGSNPDFRVVQGCLARLVDQGLVRRVDGARFQRVRPRVSLKPSKEPDTVPPSATKPDNAPPSNATPIARVDSPLDRLAVMAGALREQAQRLNAMADVIEAVALDYEAQLQRTGSDSAKLRQLQALLKGLGE